MGMPISEAEASAQLPYIERALGAATPDERRSALVDALLAFGHRFGYALQYLAESSKEADGQDDRFEQLAEEFQGLLESWLGREQLTDRADENERRAAAAVAVAKESPALGGLAAQIVLALPEGNPQRDVGLVRQLLEAYQTAEGETPSAETELSALARLIDLEQPEEAALAERVERGLVLEGDVEEPVTRRSFRVNAAGRYMTLAVLAQDSDDLDGQQRLASRGVDLLEDLEPDGGIVGMLAALFAILNDDARAAETFHRVVEDPAVNQGPKLDAAKLEARMRFNLGEHDQVVELLEPRLAAFEARYLTAVADEDVETEGESFGDVTINLAFSHAHLGNWHEAVAVLDRGKSRRARYRAALRSTPEGAEILERERELYALTRGAAQRPPVMPDAHVDPLAAGVTPQASLLEAYRKLRPQLDGDALATPSLTDLAGVLAADEAALILGQRSEGAMVVAVRPGDSATPAIARVVPITADRWVDVLAPEEGYGWLTALEARADRAEVATALRRMLEVADELVRTVADELHSDGVRRLVVVPHRLLHLVPFWAVPSLTSFQVETAPSAAALVSARGEAAPRLGSNALVVVNPTGDLRIATAEGDAVERRMAALGVSCRRLARTEATEPAVLDALAERPGVLHFCGHGRSNVIHPERSALLVCPDPELATAGDDPFDAWTSAVQEWQEDGDVRSGDVPGVGRVIEEQADGTLERRLEHGAHGTLWTLYEDGRRVAVAELWSAGDMLVGHELDGCVLAVLSACESGTGSLGVAKLDEAAGLPAALQLAGAASVVGTLWPVGDAQGAVFIDELYGELAGRSGVVNLVDVVHTVRERLRSMPREAALARVAGLRAQAADPVARFALERFARDVDAGDERPFGDPYEWAPFFVTGRSEITIEEVPS